MVVRNEKKIIFKFKFENFAHNKINKLKWREKVVIIR